MNFCVAILILKMEEKRNILRILFFKISRTVKTQRQNVKKKKTKMICEMYGKDDVTDQACQKRFTKFHAGDFLVYNAPWTRIPVERDNNKIKMFTENSQHYTKKERVNKLKISKSSVYNY